MLIDEGDGHQDRKDSRREADQERERERERERDDNDDEKDIVNGLSSFEYPWCYDKR